MDGSWTLAVHGSSPFGPAQEFVRGVNSPRFLDQESRCPGTARRGAGSLGRVPELEVGSSSARFSGAEIESCRVLRASRMGVIFLGSKSPALRTSSCSLLLLVGSWVNMFLWSTLRF